MRSGAIGNIIINAHRERVRLLKHHADSAPQQIHIHALIDILAVQKHLPRDAAALNQIIHTVQALEQSGFAAAGGPDECRNFLFRQLQIDVFQRMKIAII